MSETNESTTPTSEPEAAQPEAPKPKSPAESSTDWEAEAKKWEKRSKENFTTAQRVPQLEQQLETLQSQLNDAEHRVTESTVDAYREAARLFAGIPQEDADLFLTGGDKDTLSKQAARLAEKFAQQQPTAGHVPAEGRAPEALALNSNGLEQALKSKLGIV